MFRQMMMRRNNLLIEFAVEFHVLLKCIPFEDRKGALLNLGQMDNDRYGRCIKMCFLHFSLYLTLGWTSDNLRRYGDNSRDTWP